MSNNVHELDHLRIPLDRIRFATNNFSDHNFIAKGGFGKVYKGQLPVSGSSSWEAGCIDVAVKRLDLNGGQGNREFLTEITMLANYKHENLATLVGFSEENGEKVLVYKHEARGSLDEYIATKDLTWLDRLRICLGAARGLDYLHSGVAQKHRVVHRDIKSSNILLDANWEPKISDFGLSKIGLKNQQYSFLVTNACGTWGYVDPQYMTSGVLSKESDVYSFGMVLFEVLCGRLAVVSESQDRSRFLCTLVKDHYGTRNFEKIILSHLHGRMKPDSLEKFSTIAYRCLNADKKQRPAMGLIVKELEVALKLQMDTIVAHSSSSPGPRQQRLWLGGSSTGGSPWSFLLKTNEKLQKLIINHKEFIYSIIFTTEDLSTCEVSSQQHGGSNGLSGCQYSTICFDVDEEIVGIQGTVHGPYIRRSGYNGRTGHAGDGRLISSLCILTNKNTHGPFGPETDNKFSESWDAGCFAGFFGRAGFYLNALGVNLDGSCHVYNS